MANKYKRKYRNCDLILYFGLISLFRHCDKDKDEERSLSYLLSNHFTKYSQIVCF